MHFSTVIKYSVEYKFNYGAKESIDKCLRIEETNAFLTKYRVIVSTKMSCDCFEQNIITGNQVYLFGLYVC